MINRTGKRMEDRLAFCKPLLVAIILSVILITAYALPATAQTVSFMRLDRVVMADDPFQIVAGDFNHDGNLDLALSDKVIPKVYVLLGQGDGSFGSETAFATNGPAFSLLTADFNHDGNLDIVMAVPSRNSVTILLGTGNGSFGSALEIPTNGTRSPLSIATGDFNHDGKLDLMVALVGSNNISFLAGHGDGTFSPYTTAGVVRDDPQMIIAADFNGDGKLDIATANQDFIGVSLALGTGAGTLQPAVDILTGGVGAAALTTADFNKDGRLDLAFISPPNQLSVIGGNGDGTFGPATTLAVNDARAIITGDFNMDGHLDLVATNFASGSVTFFPGTGDISGFGPRQDFTGFDRPIGLVSGDFNNDCRPDLALTTVGNGEISVLLNTTPKPPLQIVGVEVSPQVLWPPNHRLVDVTVAYEEVSPCPSVVCRLGVTSNEPESGQGEDFAPDWIILDAHHIRLRAERSPSGAGRIYTILITCTDRSGSFASQTVTVSVPRKLRN
jgi:hypothetical protein